MKLKRLYLVGLRKEGYNKTSLDVIDSSILLVANESSYSTTECIIYHFATAINKVVYVDVRLRASSK